MYKGPFKWWVQSVMPLVFDDSLSYYEVLAKLTKYIEGLTGDVEQIEKILATIEGIEDVTEFTRFLETIQTEIGDLANLSTQSKTNLVSAINEIALKADIAYFKPPTGIPESDLSQEVQNKLNNGSSTDSYIINNVTLKKAPNNNSPDDLGLGTYSVPSDGIPWDTLSQDVKDRINAGGSGSADYGDLVNKPQINGHILNGGNNSNESLGIGTYSKPRTGIPESDLSEEVQEKLNTSGGIADSESDFFATRNYEAGELIYINGVLYKTKYMILRGSNLIPGNNIEVTDISNEIERIDNDINALQSGSGPDSWNLSTVVRHTINTSPIVPDRFFEYFNCIGGENYNFIVTLIEYIGSWTGSVRVDVNIIKRDGTVVDTITNANMRVNSQIRHTFTPTDTGEYYCELTGGGNTGDTYAFRVEIEYTQSQGISELWAQVNKATQLEPRVSALETLVAQHQARLDELNQIFEAIIPDNVKLAMDVLFSKAAYADADAATSYAIFQSWLPTVESIDAVFTQGSAIIHDTDSLNSLKQYLRVTAHLYDGTSAIVTDYNLSGTLAVGVSTITVTYRGKRDTFNVYVSEIVPLYEWNYTLGKSILDYGGFQLNDDRPSGSTAVYDANRGMVLTNPESSSWLSLVSIDKYDYSAINIEIVMAAISFAGDNVWSGFVFSRSPGTIISDKHAIAQNGNIVGDFVASANEEYTIIISNNKVIINNTEVCSFVPTAESALLPVGGNGTYVIKSIKITSR